VILSRRIRQLIIAVLVLGLPALVLRAHARAPDELNFVDRAVLRASAPIQHGLSWLFQSVAHVWSRYIYLVDLRQENQRLKTETAQLRADLGRARLEAARTTRLEQLLGLRTEVPSETLTARIIGIETSSMFRVIRVRLDRGEGEVKPGMPVLTPAGVVGRVSRVFGRYCDVLLTVDPKSSIDVVLPRTGGRGVLKGMAASNGYRARIDYLLRSDEVKEGDEVVTSGVGGVFPRGLPVGKVSQVGRRDFGLYQEAQVMPSVDFSRLEEVLVVLAPPPPPDPDTQGAQGTRHASDPNYGLGAPR
jgi:rod shape-determining protein MreC